MPPKPELALCALPPIRAQPYGRRAFVARVSFNQYLNSALHKGFGPMYWRVALLVLLIASVPQAKAEPPDEQALRLLNHYRQIAGLTPVKLDRQLSAGCMEHANYMVQNQGTDAMAGLNPHTQRSNLPGASAAGAACAKAADLFLGVSDLGVAIDEWMAGMYHRRPMLDPNLERIGIGYARLPDGMLTAALRFENAREGRTGPSRILRTSRKTFRWIMAQSSPTRSPTMVPGAIRSRCSFHRSIRLRASSRSSPMPRATP